MKKIFTSFFLFFVFAFFLNTVVAQNGASFGPAPSGTEAAKNGTNTSNVANPLSRAFCYNGNINFQLNKQSLSNTTLTPVGSTVPFVFPGAAAWNYSNNRLYVIDQGSPFALYTVDTLTGVRTFIANCTGVPQNNFTGMTWDPVTGNMYGVSSTISVSQIFTVNITTGVCTPIGSPTATVPGAIMINAARSGSLFTVDIVGDNLYRWNKTTGVPTLIGPIGFNANFGQDAHFDLSDGQYYWAAFNSSAGQAQLRTIDTLNGSSVLVGSYAGQVATFGIYTPLAPSVTINQAVGQPDPTSSAPINFTAVFDQAVTGFATGDVTISGTAGATTATVTGSGSTYNVSVSGMTVGGTVIVNIPAGVATNSNGDLNTASTSTDNQVTYSLPAGCTSVDNVPNQTVCTGSPTAPVNFSSPTPGTTFSWTNNNPAIGLAASGNGNIPSFIATNPGVTPITGTITVTPFVFTSGGPCTGSAAQTFTNNTPVAIPTGPAVVTSTVVVSGAPSYLLDVNLQTFITHTFASDLDITITSPAGTVVTLTTDNGGGNDNVFNGTLWDDDANPLGQVPYTNNNGLVTDHLFVNLTTASPLVPEEALAAFVGENPNGTWTITISDDLGGDGGSLNSWSVIVSGLATPPNTTNSTFTNSTPVAIPSGPAVVTSTLVVAGAGTQLLDVNVRTFITHTFASDLDVTITSPAGTVVTLTTDNGGSNDNVFNGTLWDDDANPLGQVPYSTNNGLVTDHSYINLTLASPLTPEEALGAFIGENPNGTWTITISDDLGGDGGSLDSWALNFQTSTCGTLCAGPPTTFTITVSPNPNIVIVADPGTTICEGDPTLLTVRVGSSSPVGTLYDQTGVAANGAPSQVFEPANAAFTSQAADDFTVPAGTSWTITRITTLGIGTGNPTSVNVFFYANSGSNLPGAALASFNNIAFTRTGGNYDVTLPSAVVLAPGTYWMSFQVNMSFATSGQWFWGNYGPTNIGFERAWQNPGGGFGTPCTSWGYGGTGCNVGGGAANRNHRFTIIGSSIADGGPLPPGYTFLWSPAAGLSSTTSNPVAASPMNTTTYTVNVTTPGNCTRTASILITVNKRPTVTTQPANTVRCEGNTATFTVGGTGTGLTYQWQESTAGCAGPWTNLTNGGAYSGVTTPTLTVNPVTLAMNGYAYRAVLGGACAGVNNANISNCAVLTVNPNPVITVTPAVSCGSAAGICNPITASGNANTYTWSPITGLFLDCAATIPYTAGTNAATVYARPNALTVYTVTGTFTTTGCFTTTTAIVNYTPPAPTVTPSSVTMCLGDPAVLLRSSSSTSGSSTFSSGTVNIPIPDGPSIPPVPTSYPATTSNITVAGIPAGATITAVRARFNVTHPWVSDLVMALKAPNGSILNLDALLNRTNQPGANFTNTVISSAGTTPLGGVAPYTGTYRADAAGATFTAFGFTFPGGPVGYIPTTTTYSTLFNTGSVNGVWSIGIYDAGAPDAGTLNNWSLDIDYVVGVPTTPATWSPLAGLFNDAAATIPYAGTPVDSVWARPTPAGVYPYLVTVQSLPVLSMFTNPSNIVINASGPGTPYPANLTVSGLPTSGVSVDSVRLTGISHTWGDDVDILLQSPTGQNVVLMSDIGGIVAIPNATYTFRDGAPALNASSANPTGTYRPTNNGAADTWPAPGPGAITQATPTLASFGNTANVNGAWKLFVFDDVGGDAGNISGGFTIWFNVAIPACTSPARTVVVTVNNPTTVTTQPANQTICTDKVATFTVVPGGTGPFTYQWQVSTNGGNPPWTNITNGGVYSGATTSTLTITAPPVSMSGYQYRVIVTGAAPCSAATSFSRILTVNPLPVVTITADRTSLFPGMTATLTSTVTPNAPAPNGYTWLRNGVAVPGGNTGTLVVDIDNLGDYTLRVTDINGCTNTSNMITIKDSVSSKCFIYPNPTSGMFQVRYYSVANNVLPRTLTIYDAKGDRVFTKMYTIGRPYDRMDVDMRAYSKGLYWVEIGDLNGSRLSMCRVVIQ